MGVFCRRKEWCATSREDWVWQGSQRRFELRPWGWSYPLHRHFSGVPLHAEKNSRGSWGRIWFIKLSLSFLLAFLDHAYLKIFFSGVKSQNSTRALSYCSQNLTASIGKVHKCDIVIPWTLSDIRIDYILQLQRNHDQLYIYQYVLVMYAAINFNEFCRQPLLSNLYHTATQKCSMIIVD